MENESEPLSIFHSPFSIAFYGVRRRRGGCGGPSAGGRRSSSAVRLSVSRKSRWFSCWRMSQPYTRVTPTPSTRQASCTRRIQRNILDRSCRKRRKAASNRGPPLGLSQVHPLDTRQGPTVEGAIVNLEAVLAQQLDQVLRPDFRLRAKVLERRDRERRAGQQLARAFTAELGFFGADAKAHRLHAVTRGQVRVLHTGIPRRLPDIAVAPLVGIDDTDAASQVVILVDRIDGVQRFLGRSEEHTSELQ